MLVRFFRRSVYPRLDSQEAYRGSIVVMGMTFVLCAVVFLAEVISRIASAG